MMRNEFYRISNSHIFYLLILLSVIAVMLMSNFYVNNTYNDDSYFNMEINEYSSINDLNTLIDEVEIEIANLDVNSEYYENDLEQLNKEKEVYEYLISNYIPFVDLYEYSAIRDFRNDRMAFTLWSNGMVSFVCLLVSFIIVLFLLNLDYLYKTNINLYNTSRSKTDILIKKYLSYIVISVFFYILMTLLTKVFGSVLSIDKNYILLVGENINIISINELMIYDTISNCISLLFFGSLFFFVAALVRDFFISLIANLGLIAVFGFFIPYQYPDNHLLQLMQSSFDSYCEMVAGTIILWTIIIKTTIILLIGFFSIYYFKRQRVKF